tara:strand:- start:197 stop:958 length:762 start_codon:yes stop_codon:yes gene_type:complete
MSLKSVIQIIILIIIFIILGGVYFKYFSQEKIIVDESIQKSDQEGIKNTKKTVEINQEEKVIKNEEIKKKITINDEKSKLLTSKNKEITKNNESKNIPKTDKKKKENEIPNLVKDVEYLTTDKNGNKYKILATSGRTNKNDNNILDLDSVRGEITSENRSPIYIISDFAEYNSFTLGSKFYSNVVINYEDKQINCENFDINMDTNIAIAYSNVVVTDPKSTMKAGKITLNIETKEIDINPDQNNKNKVKINIK